MKSLNKVCLIGNVGEDPKISTMKDNVRCATLSLATNNTWTDKFTQERKTVVDWHRIVIYNQPLVDVAEKFIKKGTSIYVEGELKSRKYINKNGMEVTTTEVVLNFKADLIVLNMKEDEDNATPKTKPTRSSAPKYDDLNDDVPF
jgi:single-strand DNA-binding protein